MSHIFKIIVVGDGGVGKTALALRYTTKIFVETYKVTMGVDFRIKRFIVDNIQSLSLIWDTGGQERFSTIRSHYFEGAHGALIVYDITKDRSFRNVKRWFREVRKYCDDIPFILIGNKSDLEQLRMILPEDGEKMAQELECLFFEASAKTGENVEIIFRALNRLLLKHSQRKNPPINKNAVKNKEKHTNAKER